MYFVAGTNYTDPKAIEEYLNDFSIILPIFGFSSTIAKKVSRVISVFRNKIYRTYVFIQFNFQPYLKNLMKEIRNFYFDNATTSDEIVRRRLRMDSELHYIYFIEKWLQQHVTVSEKSTFYHRL